MEIGFLVQLIVNGLLLGAFYATMALGFSTIWGVMRLINLAHGEFLMMGAFVAWFFFNPDRPQNLMIAANTDNTFVTSFVMMALGVVLGFFMGESLFDESEFEHQWQRRGIGALAGLGIMGVAFSVWQVSGFMEVSLPMMTIIFISLTLALGFIISHIILYKWLLFGTLLKRRMLGYGAAAVIISFLQTMWRLAEYPAIDPFLSLPLLFILFFSLGYVLQNGFLNRLIGGPYLTMLLVTFAISIMLQNVGLMIYSGDPRRINVEYGSAINVISTITIPPTRIPMILVSVLMVGGLVAFLKNTRTGYAIRAAAQNKMAARLMGIDINEVYAITFGISLALTTMAGAMMGTFQPITPVDGPSFTLRAFSIVALGGLGKVEGVVVGGIVLGLAESLVGGYVGTGWAVAVAFILLVVMLVVRPQGIAGGLVSAED